ncbi:MAG TPA: MGMT family protein [Candidatus Angelobacter sp.]|nr:MGMT family protein [Candidatus Angelobacter sp.]
MFTKIQSVIRNIPRGKVSSYGAVAKAAGFPGAARQVVWALRQAKGLPWHRVVAAGGRIALPGEAGFEQRMRLESEGVPFSGSRVRMDECEFVFRRSKKSLTTKDTKAHKGKSETKKSGKPSPQRSQRTQRKNKRT